MAPCRLRQLFGFDCTFVTTRLVVLTMVAIGLMAFLNRPLAAAPPQPAKKDSRLALKSKNVAFTTSVDPTRAKPGDTVAFKVTAKLDPGFHVYKYAKTQGQGPVNTSFDFFDPAGLMVEGDWTPSHEPEKHKDPNFADLELVEYHENEVTWSIKLKVPEGTEPGKKVLRCQARYQVCDAKLCQHPRTVDPARRGTDRLAAGWPGTWRCRGGRGRASG